jgi:hypothetical protein
VHEYDVPHTHCVGWDFSGYKPHMDLTCVTSLLFVGIIASELFLFWVILWIPKTQKVS